MPSNDDLREIEKGKEKEKRKKNKIEKPQKIFNLNKRSLIFHIIYAEQNNTENKFISAANFHFDFKKSPSPHS